MIKKSLKLSTTNQLVDLNENSVNFDLTFKVVSEANKPFYFTIVDQEMLDINKDLDFKKIENGVVTANIIASKNVYQNYFICLKADEDVNVEVFIDKKEIEPEKVSKNEISENNKNNENNEYNYKKIGYAVGITIALLVSIYLIYKSTKLSGNIDSNFSERLNSLNIQ